MVMNPRSRRTKASLESSADHSHLCSTSRKMKPLPPPQPPLRLPSRLLLPFIIFLLPRNGFPWFPSSDPLSRREVLLWTTTLSYPPARSSRRDSYLKRHRKPLSRTWPWSLPPRRSIRGISHPNREYAPSVAGLSKIRGIPRNRFSIPMINYVSNLMLSSLGFSRACIHFVWIAVGQVKYKYPINTYVFPIYKIYFFYRTWRHTLLVMRSQDDRTGGRDFELGAEFLSPGSFFYLPRSGSRHVRWVIPPFAVDRFDVRVLIPIWQGNAIIRSARSGFAITGAALCARNIWR